MAQFGRPSADTYRDAAWTEDDATTDALWGEIDETAVDDVDYIKTSVAPTSDVYVTKLTSVEDPISSTGHVVRYRYAKSAAGGAAVDLTVQLRQGYVSEVSLGTLIQAWTHAGISEVLTTAAQTLGATETDLITNYADLYLRFVANQP